MKASQKICFRLDSTLKSTNNTCSLLMSNHFPSKPLYMNFRLWLHISTHSSCNCSILASQFMWFSSLSRPPSGKEFSLMRTVSFRPWPWLAIELAGLLQDGIAGTKHEHWLSFFDLTKHCSTKTLAVLASVHLCISIIAWVYIHIYLYISNITEVTRTTCKSLTRITAQLGRRAQCIFTTTHFALIHILHGSSKAQMMPRSLFDTECKMEGSS